MGDNMEKFLGRDPADETVIWDESKIQMYIIQEIRRMGILITGSMEQGLRSKGAGGKAKAMGLTAGLPDLWVWLDGGRPIGIELKTDRGYLSKAQRDMHDRMRGLGYGVHVVYARAPLDGVRQVKEIINELDKRPATREQEK